MLQRTTAVWTANRVLALTLGVIFALLGLITFFTPAENITGVKAVLGIFDSDIPHGVFYLIVGLLGIGAAFAGYSRTYNQVFGIVFVLIGLLALIPALYFPAGSYGHDGGLFLGITHMNAGDHILHLIAGVLALIVGFFVTDTGRFVRDAHDVSPL